MNMLRGVARMVAGAGGMRSVPEYACSKCCALAHAPGCWRGTRARVRRLEGRREASIPGAHNSGARSEKAWECSQSGGGSEQRGEAGSRPMLRDSVYGSALA